MKIRTLTQTVRSMTGKRASATVRDHAGGAEFTAHLDTGEDVYYDVTIQTNGAVFLTVKLANDAKGSLFSGYVFEPKDA
jgi:hypothetical protein